MCGWFGSAAEGGVRGMEGARPSFCGLRVKIEVKCVAQGHPGALGADAARTATLWRFAGVMFALE